MRKLWINVLAPAVLLAATTVVSSQPQIPNPMPDAKAAPSKDKDKESPAKSQLEQMLEIALKSNPDIRVAEAKSRETDAELSRTRMAVTRKVVELYNNLETARANIKVAEMQFDRLRRLSGSGGVVSHGDLESGEAKLVQAKAEVAKLEAEIPYLLGQQKLKWQKDADGKLHLVVEASADEKYQDVFDRIAAARLMQGEGSGLRVERREPNRQMSEKIRAALDKELMTVVIQAGWEPSDVLDFCHDRYGIEFNFLIKDPGLKLTQGKANIKLESVTFGAVLQWMEDSLPDHCFVVRDYGLVLMKRDKIPPGALLLNEFWKAKPKEDKK